MRSRSAASSSMFSESRSIFAMTASRFPFRFATGKQRKRQDSANFYPRCSLRLCAITILHPPFQIRAAIAAANNTRDDSDKKRVAMTEQQERPAREREEIASRVANFKATQ